MRNKVLIIIIGVFVTSCNLPNLGDYFYFVGDYFNFGSHAIRSYVKHYYRHGKNDSDTLYLDIKEIVGMDYDSCYVFDGMRVESEISEIIGVPYTGHNIHYVADWEWGIFLVRDGEVVYQERFDSTFDLGWDGPYYCSNPSLIVYREQWIVKSIRLPFKKSIDIVRNYPIINASP